MIREQKLEQAREILRALGLPDKQTNQRSGWVFLALSNIKPETHWAQAQDPMLRTVDIIEFISENYGQYYKPNSRETIRRQTLHQFEQARIVDRNRDDPSRSTHSMLNNYALTQPIIEILKLYPNGDWLGSIEGFKDNLTNLKKLYEKKLDKKKIPILLPNGKEIKLSPGKHNKLHADIIHEFCPRFIGCSGIVLYIGDTASSRNEGGKLLVYEQERLESLPISSGLKENWW